jgi:hypothetical protein
MANRNVMSEQSYTDDRDEQYDYAKLLKRREWRDKSKAVIGTSPRCEKCGRTKGRFAVHHRYYEYGRLPWHYPDDAYMVVHNGRCHREADEDREEQERDAKNYDRFGWQWELAKKEQPPRERELRRLAEYQAEFKAWLIRKGIPPEGWDWNSDMYPLWWFWNQFSTQFLADLHDRQGLLDT